MTATTPAPSQAGDDALGCDGPGCAFAIVTGIGGGALAGALLVPVGLESFYLAKGERPPTGVPIASFILVAALILPTAFMWVAGDRTGEPGFFCCRGRLHHSRLRSPRPRDSVTREGTIPPTSQRFGGP